MIYILIPFTLPYYHIHSIYTTTKLHMNITRTDFHTLTHQLYILGCTYLAHTCLVLMCSTVACS